MDESQRCHDRGEGASSSRTNAVAPPGACEALCLRVLRGPVHSEQYVGPLRRGWRLGPGAAEELAELLALAVVKADAIGHQVERTR